MSQANEPASVSGAVSGVDVLYRVYCARSEMPPLEKLLARLTSGNPHNPPGSYVFPRGAGLRRLQDALGASRDFFVMGYTKQEAPQLWSELDRALGEQACGFEDQDRSILQASTLCVVLRATIANPESNDYIETLVHLADAFRELLQGVVWDVRMERIFGFEEWRERVMEEPFSVLNHVSLRKTPGAGGTVHVATRGLLKFGAPDLEIFGVPAEQVNDVSAALLDVAEHVAQGELIEPGESVEYAGAKIRFVPAPPGPEPPPNPVLRLIDEGAADPTGEGGAPKLLARLREGRESVEGRRAGGGRPAEG